MQKGEVTATMPPPQNVNDESNTNNNKNNSITVNIESLVSSENAIDGNESNSKTGEELLPAVDACTDSAVVVRGMQRPAEGTSSTAASVPTGSEKSLSAEGGGDSGRERLKRHRVEMAGNVWIPDMWGQENLLKDWTDCTAFDSALVNSSIMSARAALVDEGRSRNSTSFFCPGEGPNSQILTVPSSLAEARSL